MMVDSRSGGEKKSRGNTLVIVFRLPQTSDERRGKETTVVKETKE